MEVNEKEFKDNHLLDDKYDVFKFDYGNQNIENNVDFKKWKAKIEKENSNKIKIYKCNDYKICFYKAIYDECFRYYDDCPICKKSICCFCSQYIKAYIGFYRDLESYCCLKRIISFIFFREKFLYKDFPIARYILAYIAFIIPYINSTGLILCIIQNLFCFRTTRNNKNRFYDNFDLFDREPEYFTLIKVINVGFALCCSISYLSLTLSFMVIIFLFSIPFKMKPLLNLIFFVSQNAAYGTIYSM